jgi:aconitate hydratase 2/2-methylisocitrate dehydratase
MLEAYRQHVAERAALGIPPLPLTKQQTSELVELLRNPPKGEEATLVDLITQRVPAGVDDAAKVKAEFLARVAKGEEACTLISREKATELLGTMVGGYNVKPLIDVLDDAVVGAVAAKALKSTLLMFDFFHDVADKAKAGSANAKAVMQSWADAEWFTQRPEVPKKISVTVFKVTGETNTDDLSPAPDAWSRPDIPLHALAMLKNPRDGITPEKPGERGPMKLIEDLKKKGPSGRLRRRRGRHRLVAQVGHQLRAVVDRRRHSLRPQQALRRLLPGQQDRPDLLQYPGRCRRLPDRVRCRADGHGRRDRHLPL